jgi:hypothetical protein
VALKDAPKAVQMLASVVESGPKLVPPNVTTTPPTVFKFSDDVTDVIAGPR